MLPARISDLVEVEAATDAKGLSIGRVVSAYLSHDGLDRLAAKSVAPLGDMTHRR
jgi:hypothetical protein